MTINRLLQILEALMIREHGFHTKVLSISSRLILVMECFGRRWKDGYKAK